MRPKTLIIVMIVYGNSPVIRHTEIPQRNDNAVTGLNVFFSNAAIREIFNLLFAICIVPPPTSKV